MISLSVTLRAYLVDDEILAIRRLTRLLDARGGVEVVGSTTDPNAALEFLTTQTVDLLFLDILMPGMNGFELLEKLPAQPLVIFTTAYDKHALRAFEVNSIDYLLKPIEPRQLERALGKVNALQHTAQTLALRSQIKELVKDFADHFGSPDQIDRVASRLGDRTVFIELNKITHFSAEDKLTYAVTETKRYIVDHSLSDLEQRLSSRGFQRIHRATLLNLSFVDELHRWFGGKLLVRLGDKRRTELSVSRDQVKALKDRLGLA
jgi:two-component system, LytTR family, response regulator